MDASAKPCAFPHVDVLACKQLASARCTKRDMCGSGVKKLVCKSDVFFLVAVEFCKMMEQMKVYDNCYVKWLEKDAWKTCSGKKSWNAEGFIVFQPSYYFLFYSIRNGNILSLYIIVVSIPNHFHWVTCVTLSITLWTSKLWIFITLLCSNGSGINKTTLILQCFLERVSKRVQVPFRCMLASMRVCACLCVGGVHVCVWGVFVCVCVCICTHVWTWIVWMDKILHFTNTLIIYYLNRSAAGFNTKYSSDLLPHCLWYSSSIPLWVALYLYSPHSLCSASDILCS